MPLLAYVFGTRGKIDAFKAIEFRGDYWFFADLNGWAPVTVAEAKARFVKGAK